MTYLTVNKSNSLVLEKSEKTLDSPPGSGMFVAIDPRVDNYDDLAQGVMTGAEVLVMDLGKDGVEQITAALQTRQNSLTSLHIISHGEIGKVQLGSNWLGADNLDDYAPQLAQWGKAFAGKAEILLYGCNVAGDETGVSFIWRLSELTGATVAASHNLTGNAAQGGDWDLQVSTGKVNAGLALTENVRENYQGVLVPTVTGVSMVFPSSQAAPPFASITTGPIVYQVVFNEPVINVDAADFLATPAPAAPSPGATVGGVTPVSTTTYNVTVNLEAGFNTSAKLDFVASPTINAISDNSLFVPPGGFPDTSVGASSGLPAVPTVVNFFLDVNADGIADTTRDLKTTDQPKFFVEFSSPINTTAVPLDGAQFQFKKDGGAFTPLAATDITATAIAGSATKYALTLNTAGLYNTAAVYNLDFIAAPTIKDFSNQAVTDSTGAIPWSANQVPTVGAVAPTVTVANSSTAYNFSPTFTDTGVTTTVGPNILESSLDLNDFVIVRDSDNTVFPVTAPGFTVDAPAPGNTTPYTAKYTFTSPAGLTSAANGSYTIYAVAGQIQDTGATVGSFNGTAQSVPGLPNATGPFTAADITAAAAGKLGTLSVNILPPPTVSITRLTTPNPNNLENPVPLEYTVVFSEALTTAADTALTTTPATYFKVTSAGNPALTTAPTVLAAAKDTTDATGKTYIVKVDPSTGLFDGTIQLDFDDPSNVIVGAASNLPVLDPVSGPGFTVDRVQPVATFIPPVASPNNGVTPLTGTLKFSEPVDNVDITDLSINNGAVITGVTPVAGSTTDYTVTIGNATLATGNYTIQLGVSDIVDKVGNPLFAPILSSFGVDSDFPVPVIGTISSPAKSTALNAVEITFNEPVVSGFDLTKFSLTTPDGTVLTAIDDLTSDILPGSSFTLDLSNEATTDGTYTLSLVQQGATDGVGNVNTNATPVTATFTVDNTAPTATITEVIPDPTNVGVPDDTVFVDFSEPVNGFDAGDLRLNGAAVTGAAITQVTTSQWKISGITTATATAGAYTLSIDGAGATPITDLATNALGTVTPETWTVDTTPPTAPVISTPPAGLTNDPTPSFTGTAEANSTVKLFSGTNLIGSPIADSSGKWSFVPTTTLADGNYSLTANATDAAGNTSPASTALDLTVDTTPPGAPVINAPGTSITAIPTITGTAEPNSSVKVFSGTNQIGNPTADSSGKWSLTPTIGLANGNYNLTATATDAAGNTSPPSTEASLTVQTPTPTPAPITQFVQVPATSTGGSSTGTTPETTTPTTPAKVYECIEETLLEPTPTKPSGLNVVSVSSSGETRGTNNADDISGTDNNDTIFGNQGNDYIDGLGGNDLLRGGKDNDIVVGGSGTDNVYGDLGNDTITGDDDGDFLFGGKEDDWLLGGTGDDRLVGQKDKDVLFGGDNNDILSGETGNDTLIGGGGDDLLNGGKENDVLDGGLGNNSLNGDQGDDTLYGCPGNNNLTGGSGNDLFIIGFPNSSNAITDFTQGQDKIAVSGAFFSQLDLVQDNANTLIKLKSNGEQIGTLLNVNSSSLTSSDFLI